jgi:hypothetical protein
MPDSRANRKSEIGPILNVRFSGPFKEKDVVTFGIVQDSPSTSGLNQALLTDTGKRFLIGQREIEMGHRREPAWRIRHAKCLPLQLTNQVASAQADRETAAPPSQSIEPQVRLG